MRHLYLHVPFCARRCSYCDFSIAVRRETPVEDYLRAVGTELSMRLPPTELETVYLGGGTPSRLGGAGVAGVLERVRDRATIAPDAEITVEANPEDVTHEGVSAWRAAGVNRLSLGAQSFDHRVLQWMHRAHSADRIADAVRVTRDGGIENISIDLIFALPESLERNWSRDLDRAIALEPEHVSLYGLTVEPATPLGRWRERGQVTETPEEAYETEFLEAHRALSAAGFEHYEVSNFGLPNRRARHNSAYWKRVAYLGAGPSAHSFDGVTRSWNVAAYAEWQQRLDRGESPDGGSELLDDGAREAERVYLGLRTSDGLALRDDERERARPWISSGWATDESGMLRLTPLGWLRLDALAADLTAVRSR